MHWNLKPIQYLKLRRGAVGGLSLSPTISLYGVQQKINLHISKKFRIFKLNFLIFRPGRKMRVWRPRASGMWPWSDALNEAMSRVLSS